MSKCKGAVFPGRWRIAIFRVMDVMMAKTDNRANIWQSWWIYDYKPYKIYKVNNWSNVQTLTTLTIYYKLSWMPKYWMLYTLLKIIYSAISGQCHLLGNWLIKLCWPNQIHLEKEFYLTCKSMWSVFLSNSLLYPPPY